MKYVACVVAIVIVMSISVTAIVFALGVADFTFTPSPPSPMVPFKWEVQKWPEMPEGEGEPYAFTKDGIDATLKRIKWAVEQAKKEGIPVYDVHVTNLGCVIINHKHVARFPKDEIVPRTPTEDEKVKRRSRNG